MKEVFTQRNISIQKVDAGVMAFLKYISYYDNDILEIQKISELQAI